MAQEGAEGYQVSKESLEMKGNQVLKVNPETMEKTEHVDWMDMMADQVQMATFQNFIFLVILVEMV